MPIYNLFYYSKKFRKTIGSFRNYYPDTPSSGHVGNNVKTRIIYAIKDSKSFDYETKLVGHVPGATDDPDIDVQIELEDIKIAVPLKNLSNFMFNLDFLMINAEIELVLKYLKIVH